MHTVQCLITSSRYL